MSILPFHAYTCPLDGGSLLRQDRVWRCANGHSFDEAREGYVNLLPVQNKRSKDPGDSREMVLARSRFLQSGAYEPIAETVSGMVLSGLSEDASLNCLDAGCGEGYYLRHLCRAGESLGSLHVLGLDISKWAIQAAAKRDSRSAWVVGSNARLPLPSASVDWILSLFGFPVYPEFARVLKQGACLLQADAGTDHLRELREIIYPSLNAARKDRALLPEGFAVGAVQQLRYPIYLESAQKIADLLAMTPHLYRASVAGRERAAALSNLSVTVDVRLSCLVRV
jgi:23S rRNA (guanine745-N1)-methyltransferase